MERGLRVKELVFRWLLWKDKFYPSFSFKIPYQFYPSASFKPSTLMPCYTCFTPLNPHKDPLKLVQLSSPCYRWRWGLERLVICSQLASARGGIGTQAVWLLSPCREGTCILHEQGDWWKHKGHKTEDQVPPKNHTRNAHGMWGKENTCFLETNRKRFLRSDSRSVSCKECFESISRELEMKWRLCDETAPVIQKFTPAKSPYDHIP